MYGPENPDGYTSLSHDSTLDFGDPYRKHRMQCRYCVKIPVSLAVITTPSGVFVICMLAGYIIYAAWNPYDNVKEDCRKMVELKVKAESADVAKSQVESLHCTHFCVGMVKLVCFLVIKQKTNFSLIKRMQNQWIKNAIEKNKTSRYLMWFMAMLGSCSVIASGVLVPTISVLSASSSFARSLGEILFHSPRESAKLQVDSDIPIAYTIVLGLFILQHYGTHKMDFLFAPIIIAWLLFISGLGVYNILHWDAPIISSLSPYYMFNFLRNLDMANWRSLGVVILCTGPRQCLLIWVISLKDQSSLLSAF